MPCLLGCLALLMPRFVIVLVVLFSDYIGSACQTVLWPLLGFLFMPMTTLAYAWAFNSSGGAIQGFGVAVIVLAVLIDLGLLGGGASNKQVWSRLTAKR
jgi:hypothetical protein